MYLVADCETSEFSNDTDKMILKIVCVLKIVDKQIVSRHCFEDANKFNQYIKNLYFKNKKKKIKVFFHNLRFDSKFVIKDSAKYIVKNSLILRASTQYATFCDSFSILNASVESLGKAFNLKKLDMKKDDLIEYCYRDCEIVHLALERQAELLGKSVESLGLTMGSEMHKMFHEKNKQYEFEDEEKRKRNALTSHDTSLYRRFYFGARCEVYSKKRYEVAYAYDINSMYAFIQTNFAFPVPPYARVKTDEKIADLLKNPRFFGAECVVFENHFAPFIPQKDEKSKRLVFAKGWKKCFLFREEIEYCLEKQYDIQIEYAHFCSKFDYIFSYIKDLYERRKNSKDESEKAAIKSMLVRSYGKFAEKEENDEFHVVYEPNDELEQDLVKKGYKIADGCKDYPLLYSKKAKSKKRNNLCIAARVTALARLVQQRYIDFVLERYGQDALIYTDTDSVFTNAQIEEWNSTELGKMKLENTYHNFQAHARKFYVSDEKVKLKGVPSKLPIQEKLKFLDDGVNYSRPAGFREAFRRNLDVASVVHVLKKQHTFVKYRIEDENGSTLPLNDLSDFGMPQNDYEREQQWIKEMNKNAKYLRKKSFTPKRLSRHRQFYILYPYLKEIDETFDSRDIDENLSVEENYETIMNRTKDYARKT